ncbi:MAG TPA: PepSY-associated TM helix domain-containing protein [Vicinamibacterales bacterium]|nr:PepSY-associated TM helix domain-containing protein [Vicinamibacterales bacterium]
MARESITTTDKLRRWLFWTHLALGLLAGVAIFTMSITGALLALQPQVLEWLERDQRRVAPSQGLRRLEPSALIGAAANGSRPGTVSITLSANPTEAALVTFGRDGVRYVDPYRGTVLGAGAPAARRTFQGLTEFHRWFASSTAWRGSARAVTGWSTLAFVLLVASGSVLWLPRRRTRAALIRSITPAWPSAPRARHFNWHTVVGFWCAPVLLVLASTGVILAFPWANRMLYAVAGSPLPLAPRVAPDGIAPGRPTDVAGGRATLPDERSIDAAWRVAELKQPSWQTIALRIQGPADGPLSFTITDKAHWNRFARSQLVVSGRTGNVVRWEPYSGITRGQRWRGWARFAHTGELGGLAGQLLAGAASAGAALLVWTGLSLALSRLGRTGVMTRLSTPVRAPDRAA